MARLFVGIRPPLAVRERLLDATGGIDGARWQDEDQLQLKLAFVGDVGKEIGRELCRERV